MHTTKSLAYTKCVLTPTDVVALTGCARSSLGICASSSGAVAGLLLWQVVYHTGQVVYHAGQVVYHAGQVVYHTGQVVYHAGLCRQQLPKLGFRCSLVPRLPSFFGVAKNAGKPGDEATLGVQCVIRVSPDQRISDLDVQMLFYNLGCVQ